MFDFLQKKTKTNKNRDAPSSMPKNVCGFAPVFLINL